VHTDTHARHRDMGTQKHGGADYTSRFTQLFWESSQVPAGVRHCASLRALFQAAAHCGEHCPGVTSAEKHTTNTFSRLVMAIVQDPMLVRSSGSIKSLRSVVPGIVGTASLSA
jgi:hypothetical protein